MHGVVQSKDIDAGIISTNIELPRFSSFDSRGGFSQGSILVVMILLVKIVGHVNIFVFLFFMITLTVFILILLILVFFKRLCACLADWCQVRALKIDLVTYICRDMNIDI